MEQLRADAREKERWLLLLDAHAEGQRLAGQAWAELPTNPGLALLLAVEGAEHADRAQSREAAHNNALLAALRQCRERRTFRGPDVPPTYGLRPHVSFTSARYSPDGSRVTTLRLRLSLPRGDDEGPLPGDVLTIGDARTGQTSATVKVVGAPIDSATFSPDGRTIATTLRNAAVVRRADGREGLVTNATVRLWDAATGRALAVLLPGGKPRDHVEFLYGAFSPDGTRGLVAESRAAVLWDAAGGQTVSVLKGHAALRDARLRNELLGEVCDFQFSPDGRRVVTVSRDPFPRRQRQEGGDPVYPFTPVRVWDTRTGKELFALRGFRRSVRTASFRPDGKQILTFADGNDRHALVNDKGQIVGSGSWGWLKPQVQVWDADTGRLVRTLLGENASCDGALWSPDGHRIFTGRTGPKGASQIWDADTGRVLLTLEGEAGDHGPIEEARFSPDGRYLVGFRRNHVHKREIVSVWDAATGKPHALLAGHQGDITSAAFSPDGKWVVTTSTDGTARVWDVATGKPRHVLYGGRAVVVHAAAFSPDGRWLVTAADDWTAGGWSPPPPTARSAPGRSIPCPPHGRASSGN